MKKKDILYITAIFFILLNTAQFWEANLGIFSMITVFIMICYFGALVILLAKQVFYACKEHFREIKRLGLILFMAFVLFTSYKFPHGIVSWGNSEDNSLLIARREGAANCMTTLNLHSDQTFRETNICFGLSQTNGEYCIDGDTVFFENVSLGRGESEYFEFGVIERVDMKNDYLGNIIRYKDKTDTVGVSLWIQKNTLENLPKNQKR